MPPKVISETVSSELLHETMLTQAVCSVMDTPRSLAVALLVEHQEWRQLLDLRTDAGLYEDVGNFADDYLATCILRKSVNLPIEGVDRKAEALRKFYSAELRCRETNERLLRGGHPDWWHRFQNKLARILGPVDRLLSDIPLLIRNGPGASIGVKGDGMVASDKFDQPLSITEELLPFYEAIVGETVAEYRPRRSCRVVKGNQFFSVPKDAETERGACTEPTVNVMLQLAIGEYLASRLKVFGVDINDQSWNQHLASMCEELGLATLDLSQASDLLAWSLVLEGLPLEWAHLLTLASCRFTHIEGRHVELEKFCSMGNGFTFPLETVVFLALIQTFCPREDLCRTAVYGDDMIVPRAVVKGLVDALDYSGFKVNTKKSFLAGNFFESCGRDFFRGVNVRPFFLRRQPDDPIPYPLSSANSLRLWANRRNCSFGCDGRFRKVWLSLKGALPHPWNECRVPGVLGDSGLLSSQEELKKVTRKPKDGWEGGAYKCVMFEPERVDRRTFGVFLAHMIGKRESAFTARSRRSLNWLFPEGSQDVTRGLEPRRGYLRSVRSGWVVAVNRDPDLAWYS